MSVTPREISTLKPDSSNRVFVVAMLAVLVLAGAVRLYGLGNEAYWLDELHSLANSAGRRADFEALPNGEVITSAPRFTELTPNSTPLAVWRGMDVDSHPPLYFLLLREWRVLFGDSEFAVRSLSVLFSVLSLIPVGLMLRAYGLPRTAWWVVAVMALAFSHIHIGQEARPYSLGLLFVSLSYWFFARIEVASGDAASPRRWSVLYGLSLYLAVMTHYFTTLALAGQVAVAAVSLRGPGLRRWLAATTVAAIAFLVTWGRQFYGQLPFIANQPWLMEERSDHVARTLWRLADTPVRLLVAHERFQFNVALAIVGIGILTVALICSCYAGRGDGGRRVRSARAVLVAWCFVPLAALATSDLVTDRQTLSHIRYTSVALPGLAGLLVLSGLHWRKWRQVVVVATFLVVVLLSLRLPSQDNPHSSRAAELISSQAAPGDLLVFDGTEWPDRWASRLYHIVGHYLPDYLSGPMPPFVLLRKSPDAALRVEMIAFRRLLLVSPHVDDDPNPLPASFTRKDKTGYVHGIGYIHLLERIPE